MNFNRQFALQPSVLINFFINIAVLSYNKSVFNKMSEVYLKEKESGKWCK
jgi:hypothetical protein